MKDHTQNLFGPEDELPQIGHRIQIAFESGADTEFTYLVRDELWPVQLGRRVEAPFGRRNKLQVGFCVAADVDQPGDIKLKAITKVVDEEPLLNAELMSLARWISTYYVCPLGQVLAAMVPAAVKKGTGVRKEKLVYMAEFDSEVISRIRGKKQKSIIEYLQNKEANNGDSAVLRDEMLEDVGCTAAPLKALGREGIIKLVERQSYPKLPAIPEAMRLVSEDVILNEDQQRAYKYFKKQIDFEKFAVSLLYGVTDSGKTELYIRAIEDVIAKGKSAIVLLPEIALTAQTVQRFSDRFKRIAVMHSGLTGAQRNAQWQSVKAGEADVIIGARSAIFAPVENLGLVVVDEEHEASYKQDTVPRYHGRDVAIKRCQLAGGICILGSATPCLESLSNCKGREHFDLVKLPRRVKDLPLPEMRLVDLREVHRDSGTVELVTEPLLEHLKQAIANGEQAILLLNRRGYSNFVFCPSCKHMLHCRNCDVTLTFHKAKMKAASVAKANRKLMDYGYALCHYCGAQTLVLEKCQLCGKGMAMIGFGAQRLQEELKNKLPGARIKRVDSDSMAHSDYYHMLKDFSLGKIDVLAGTQMLAKGLHFPNVTVVGIISAESSLYLPDFRANERTFQLISQVAGRTGRGDKKGTVYVQTFLPDQPAILYAMKNDFEGFVAEELKHRRQCNLPPCWRMANITIRHTEFEKLKQACVNMRQRIDDIIRMFDLQMTVRGPVPAIINRIQRYHRMQMVVQAPEAGIIQQLFAELRLQKPVKPAVQVAIDIDPVNLL